MKDGWIVKKLGEVCEINYGTRVVQKKDGGTIYPVYGGGGATFKMDIYNREDCLVVSRFAMSSQCVRYVRGKFFLNDSGLTVKTNNVCLSQEYLDKCILSLNDKIYSLGKGVAQKNLDMKEFRNLNIHYPISLPEQSRIVEELDQLSNIIEKKRQQLSELDNLAQSIFYDMFVSKAEQWQVKSLIDIYKFIDYRGKTPNKIDSGVPLITARNIRRGYIDYSIKEFISEAEFCNRQSRGIAKRGDLLFTTEAPMGYAAIADLDTFSTGQRLISFQQREVGVVSNIYVLYYLLSDIFQTELNKQATGATVKGIKGSKLEKMIIPLPPLYLQQLFAQKIEAIEKEKELIKQSIAETKELFNSRMDYYFG